MQSLLLRRRRACQQTAICTARAAAEYVLHVLLTTCTVVLPVPQGAAGAGQVKVPGGRGHAAGGGVLQGV